MKLINTLIILLLLICGIFFYCLVRAANAHSWYDPYCCSERDCKQLQPNEVTENSDQYLVIIGGKTVYEIPKDSKVIRPSQDANFHICLSHVDMSVRCFYVPLAV